MCMHCEAIILKKLKTCLVHLRRDSAVGKWWNNIREACELSPVPSRVLHASWVPASPACILWCHKSTWESRFLFLNRHRNSDMFYLKLWMQNQIRLKLASIVLAGRDMHNLVIKRDALVIASCRKFSTSETSKGGMCCLPYMNSC